MLNKLGKRINFEVKNILNLPKQRDWLRSAIRQWEEQNGLFEDAITEAQHEAGLYFHPDLALSFIKYIEMFRFSMKELNHNPLMVYITSRQDYMLDNDTLKTGCLVGCFYPVDVPINIRADTASEDESAEILLTTAMSAIEHELGANVVEEDYCYGPDRICYRLVIYNFGFTPQNDEDEILNTNTSFSNLKKIQYLRKTIRSRLQGILRKDSEA